jgi:hypothetical protein
MLDIVEVEDGKDIVVADSSVAKAANVLSVQLGTLEYAKDFGVDLRFFLTSNLRFQNDSFRAYLVERLARHQVNVTEVPETIDALFGKYTFMIGGDNENEKGLIV